MKKISELQIAFPFIEKKVGKVVQFRKVNNTGFALLDKVLSEIPELVLLPLRLEPSSPIGLVPLTANVVNRVLTENEVLYVKRYEEKIKILSESEVLVQNIGDSTIGKVVSRTESSRYFEGGRNRIKRKIRKALGRWYNCHGILLTLTFNPEVYSRERAWELVGSMKRRFMDSVNHWRKLHDMGKVAFLSVIEEQPSTGYPHVHMVFPYLKYLCGIKYMGSSWGNGDNAVDVRYIDGFSPVFYITKYITKIEGWTILGLAYLMVKKIRLYSMARNYKLTDYEIKGVPQWVYSRKYEESLYAFLSLFEYQGFTEITGVDWEKYINSP